MHHSANKGLCPSKKGSLQSKSCNQNPGFLTFSLEAVGYRTATQIRLLQICCSTPVMYNTETHTHIPYSSTCIIILSSQYIQSFVIYVTNNVKLTQLKILSHKIHPNATSKKARKETEFYYYWDWYKVLSHLKNSISDLNWSKLFTL